MSKKISAAQLREKMDKPGVKPEVIAPYLKIDEAASDFFRPAIVYNTDLVDMGSTPEAIQRAFLALPGFNAFVRLSRRFQFETKLLGDYTGPILVAEGDSWFTYPKLDVVGALNDTYAVSHLAAAGDTLEQMLEQDEYLEETQRTNARILLLSGGGNDALGGGKLEEVLRPFDPKLTPKEHIKSAFTAMIDDATRRFDQIFRRIAREAPGITAICHSYDYAIPNSGKWLGRPMQALGIVDGKLQRAIVCEMIDRFTLSMSRLAARYPHVVFLDNRSTVAANEWTDELHPNPAGFRKIAEKFDVAIKKAAVLSRKLQTRGGKSPGQLRRRADEPAAPVVMRGIKRPTGLNKGFSLHIGLNKVDAGHYNGEQRLWGCHNDAKAMAEIAKASGYEVMNILLDEQAKVRAVKDAVGKAASELKAGDIFLMTYAGHGASVPDSNGDEIDDGKDETWCLFDRMLIDDEIYGLWRQFAEGVRVLVVSDSCHSGSVLRAGAEGLTRIESSSTEGRTRSLSDSVRRDIVMQHRAFYARIQSEANAAGGLQAGRRRSIETPLNCTVRLLSGCQDSQLSGDGDINGLFTSRMLMVLEQGFNGNYADFHRRILKLMPDNQTPNHWVIGRKDPAFDGQQPFEI